MIEPILAFLIPSRKRFDGLLRMVSSIANHPDSAFLEINVWLDDDDHESLSRSQELTDLKSKVHVGPRGSGYSNTGLFCTLMAAKSKCPWVVLCDDDNFISGDSFIDQLRDTPLTGVVCSPEIYALNFSRYDDFYQYHIVPNGSWRCDSEVIRYPTDIWLHEVLVQKRKWSVKRLKGFTMAHDWVQSYPHD